MNHLTSGVELVCPQLRFVDCEDTSQAYGAVAVLALATLGLTYKAARTGPVLSLWQRVSFPFRSDPTFNQIHAELKRQADPNRWEAGSQYLLRAIENGHHRTFGLLIEKGVPIPELALHKALEGHRTNMISTLVEKCSLTEVDENENTPLMIAAKKGDLNSIQKMIAKGVAESINLKNRDGKTALHLAAREYPKIVEPLLTAGAFVDEIDGQGKTALHEAADQDCIESIEKLLEAGANPNIQDKDGNTPLHLTAHIQEARLKSARALLASERLDPNVLNNDGEAPLHMACQMLDGKDELALLLIESGKCDLNLLSEEVPPVSAAQNAASVAEGKGGKIIDAFCEKGADFTAGGENSPLVSALTDGRDAYAKKMIANMDPGVLKNFAHEELSICDWAVVMNLTETRKVLADKGIYFENGERDELFGIVFLKIKKYYELFQTKIPVKIKQVRELMEYLDAPDGKDAPYLYDSIKINIACYFRQIEMGDRHRQNETCNGLIAGFAEHPPWDVFSHPLFRFLPEKFQALDVLNNPQMEEQFNKIRPHVPKEEISLGDLFNYAPAIQQWLTEVGMGGGL